MIAQAHKSTVCAKVKEEEATTIAHAPASTVYAKEETKVQVGASCPFVSGDISICLVEIRVRSLAAHRD